jgi:hypothetical protein
MKGTLCPQAVMAPLQSSGQRNTPDAQSKRRMIATMCDCWWAAKIAAKLRSLPNDHRIYAKKTLINDSRVSSLTRKCYFIPYHQYPSKDNEAY